MLRHARLVGLTSWLTLTACGGSPPEGMDAAPTDAGVDAAPPPDAWVQPIERPAFEAANAVAPGDPLYEGQQRFLYDAFGTERLDTWPPADFMLALMTDEPDVFGDQYASFGFVPNPGDDFPVGFTRGLEDPTLVHETCAACHVARLADGRIWLGAPSEVDFEGFRVAVDERWARAGHPARLTPQQVAKLSSLGPGRTSAESGDYPQVVPADFPTYFNFDTRPHFNHLGTGLDSRTETYFSIFAFGAGDPNPMDAIIPFPVGARLDPMIETMRTWHAPVGPTQDATAVAAGLVIFERERCGSCHHVGDLAMDEITPYDRATAARERIPGDDPAFPRGSILTDYWHRILIDGEPPIAPDGATDLDAGSPDAGRDVGRDALIAFIVRNRLSVANSDGYRAADLSGLWATAPYLHNGSVPTLDALLRPAAERPATFMRGDFLVDTTLPANGNMGHEFGVAIDETDRAALVAYLLSL